MLNLSYEWELKNTNFEKNKGKVFSCFSCGGGSTMGYKLAGFDVIGCNEIDPRMMEVYIKNHNPKYHYCEPIQEFKNREDLPEELYNLDILDGSPPCSTFSIAGQREKNWGVEKKFREGQQKQVLDTLFFDFIDLAKKLQPKVVIAENVAGLLIKSSMRYVNKIVKDLYDSGYYVRYDLLDAQFMGIPQKRRRVFFTAIRKDLYKGWFEDFHETMPLLNLEFNEKPIPFKEIREEGAPLKNKKGKIYSYWLGREYGDGDLSFGHARVSSDGTKIGFNHNLLYDDKVANTIKSSSHNILFDEFRGMSKKELCLASSFPLDYDFGKQQVDYIVGMSVPPLMSAKVADRVYNQWLKTT